MFACDLVSHFKGRRLSEWMDGYKPGRSSASKQRRSKRLMFCDCDAIANTMLEYSSTKSWTRRDPWLLPLPAIELGANNIRHCNTARPSSSLRLIGLRNSRCLYTELLERLYCTIVLHLPPTLIPVIEICDFSNLLLGSFATDPASVESNAVPLNEFERLKGRPGVLLKMEGRHGQRSTRRIGCDQTTCNEHARRL